MHKCLNRRAWALAGLLASSAGAAERATWAGWRGPEGQGVSREQGLPVEWSATKNVAWKTALPGHGHSQPVVWGDRIFLTTDVEGEVVRPGAKGVRHVADGQEFVHPDGVGADRRHTLKVLSLNARTGRILWERTVWEGTPYDSRHRKGAYAAATPVVDGQRVISWFGSEGLYAHDFRGRLLWSASVGGIATMGVGVGTSPVLYGDLVILQCDEDNGDRSFIVAFDRETGREAWRAPRRVQVSWGTPVLVRAAGRAELVTTGTEWIIAYEPLTGKGLWRAKGLESNAVPSPVVAGDIVVLSAGYPAKLAMAIRAGGEGDVTASRVLWRYAKGTAYVPSPIAYGDHVYLVTDKGLVTCLDVRTGEVRYEGGRVPVAATFMASPVAYDGRLLLASEDGDVFAIKAGPVHEVLGTSAMGERIAASPAIAGGRIYIRGARHLFAIGAGG